MKSWLLIAVFGLTMAVACNQQNNVATPKFLLDQVNTSSLHKIRLGDGVPLNIDISVRWHIENAENFAANFGSPERYDSLILQARQYEIVSQVSNTFDDVDKVFTTHRDQYVDAIKGALENKLAEEGISIKEVIVSRLEFPTEYTEAKEKIGMQEQRLALIENEKMLTIENAKAKEEKAKAEGSVRIVEAKMEGDVSKINAETEELTRLQTLARAETQAQVIKLNAAAEAEKNKIMAAAEAERLKMIAAVDLDKASQYKEQEIMKEKEMNALALAKEKDLALLCANNPKYASFLISKELASKVQIAVLPSEDGGIFNSMLQQQMLTSKTD